MTMRPVSYMMMMLSAACGPGAVHLDGPTPFGPVRSAVWLELGSGDERSHSFAFLSAKSACNEAQDLLPALAEEEADLALKLEPLLGDTDAQCSIYKEHYARMAELTDPLFGDGLHVLSLVLRDPAESSSTPPAEGLYNPFSPDSDAPYFLGSVSLFEESPHQIRADDFDCGSNAEALDARLEEAVTTWYLTDGEADVSPRASEKAYRLTIEATLEQATGDGAGSLTAQGSLRRCEVSSRASLPF
jgi:hypothetical protein